MHLYLSILYDKPITNLINMPTPNGYNVQTKDGKIYKFNFTKYYKKQSDKTPYIIEWTGTNIDTNVSPNIEELCAKWQDIISITKCDINSKHSNDPKPLAILNFTIEDDLPFNQNKQKSNENIIIQSSKNAKTQYDFTDKLKASYVFENLHHVKTISVHVSFDFDVDVSDIKPNFVDIIGLAKELTLEEIKNEIEMHNFPEENCEIIQASNKSYL